MTSLQTKISRSTKKTGVTEPKFGCEFCNRSFQRETSIATHLCENKRRWQDKDQAGNRIGFQSWLEFYKKNKHTDKKEPFIKLLKKLGKEKEALAKELDMKVSGMYKNAEYKGE